MILETIDNLISNDIIYHYSIKKYKSLLTVNERNNLNLIDKNEYNKLLEYQNSRGFVPSYLDHISFLIDPLPVDLIVKNFKDSNNKLYTSDSCYEYSINISSLLNNLNYWRVVENPINNFFNSYLWIDMDYPGKDILFFGTRDLLNNIFKNEGSEFSNFVNTLKKYKGVTRDAYIKLINSSDFKTYKELGMYAPTVPHLMIYPKVGEIKYSSIRKIQIT